MAIGIEVLDKVTDEVVDAFGRLLPQLSSTAEPLDADALTIVISSPAVTVLLARGDGGSIIGTLTLVTSRPSRQAAGGLYLKAGFTQRETRLYRYKFS